MVDLFNKNQARIEQTLAQVAGRTIKTTALVDKNLPPPVLNNMSEPDRSNLIGAMHVFNASDVAKIID
jgi:hypothetical protein